MNSDLVLTLLIQGITHANELAMLYQKARNEGRDVTQEELDGLSAGASLALARLRAELGL